MEVLRAWWTVLPALGLTIGWIDIACMIGVGGIALGVRALGRARRAIGERRGMSEHLRHAPLSAGRSTRRRMSRFGFMLALLALHRRVLLCCWRVAYWICSRARCRTGASTQPFPDYPGTAAATEPARRHAAFYAAEMRRLNSAGWQDRGAGTVHIPIEQAMRAVAREGIPGWPAGRADASQGDRR